MLFVCQPRPPSCLWLDFPRGSIHVWESWQAEENFVLAICALPTIPRGVKKKKKREICWHTRHYIFQCFDDQRSSSSRTRYPSWKDTSNICRLMSLNRKFVVSCCGKIWSIFRGNFNRALIVFMENYSVLRERGRNMTRVK